MHGVARVTVALAVAATLSVDVNAAPAKSDSNGREELHIREERHSFELFGGFELFGSNVWRHLPFPDASVLWPPAGLSKPARSDPNSREDSHEDTHIEEQHFLYFFGSDVWQHWAFAHAGVLWSPAGLSNEGFTLKLLLNGGAYRYISGALNDTTILGRQSSVAVMPGWRFKRNGYEVTIFAGLDYQQFLFIPDDPGTNLRGRHFGLRGGFELWHEPSPTTMLAADASISSIGAGNFVRIGYGWRMFDKFYLGPEAQVYYTDPYFHARAGIHVTAFKTEDREWSGAVGYASDNDHRSGLYVRIGILTRR